MVEPATRGKGEEGRGRLRREALLEKTGANGEREREDARPTTHRDAREGPGNAYIPVGSRR